MEPKLINKKLLKKLLKKGYSQSDEDNILNKTVKGVVNIIKTNWYIILILTVLVIIFIHLYIDNQKKKQQELFEEEQKKEVKKKKKKEHFKDGYVSEYYKMLPKVTSQPEVIPYQY